MRIAYVSSLRFPSERARAYQASKVIEAFRKAHHTVELISPSLSALSVFFFRRSLRRIVRAVPSSFDALYTRSRDLLPIISRSVIPLVIEVDSIPRWGRRRFLRCLRRARLVVALTSVIRTELIDLGLASVPIIVEGDAVDLHEFDGLPSRSATRRSLEVPDEAPLVVFLGSLEVQGRPCGVQELLDALSMLRKRGSDVRAIFAGGPPALVQRFTSSLEPELRSVVRFMGHIDRMQVPTLLSAADVLVYPAPASSHPFFLRDISPLTLFEYMASGRPIVAADLPPLHDVLDTTMVRFCAPGNPASMAQEIRGALEDPEDSAKRALIARSHVEQYTWEKRMERILGAARLLPS